MLREDFAVRKMEIGVFYAQKSLDVLERASAPPQAVWRETLYVLMLRGQFSPF